MLQSKATMPRAQANTQRKLPAGKRRLTNAEPAVGSRMALPVPNHGPGMAMNLAHLNRINPTRNQRGPDWDASGYHPHVSGYRPGQHGYQDLSYFATHGRPGPSIPVPGIRTREQMQQGIRQRQEKLKANAISKKTEEARKAHPVHEKPAAPPTHHGNDDKKAEAARKQVMAKNKRKVHCGGKGEKKCKEGHNKKGKSNVTVEKKNGDEYSKYGGNKGDESKSHRDYAKPPKHHGNDDKKADAAAKKKDKDWVQEVDKEMDKDGTEGSFTRAAKKAGKSVHDYAIEVRDKYKGKEGLTEAQKRLLRRAVLALNFEKMRH